MGNTSSQESRTTRLRNRVPNGRTAFRGLHVPLRLDRHQNYPVLRASRRRHQQRRLDDEEHTGALMRTERRRSRSLPSTSPRSLETPPDLTRHFRQRRLELDEQEIERWSSSFAGTRRSSRNGTTIGNPNPVPLSDRSNSAARADLQPPRCPDCRVPYTGPGSGETGPVTRVCATCQRFVSRPAAALVSPHASIRTPRRELAPSSHTEMRSGRDQESRLLRGTSAQVPSRTANTRHNTPSRRQQLEVVPSLQHLPVPAPVFRPSDASLHDTDDSTPPRRSFPRSRPTHNLMGYLQLRTNDLCSRTRDVHTAVKGFESSAVDILHDYDFLRDSPAGEEPISLRSSHPVGIYQAPLTDDSPPDNPLAAAQNTLLKDLYASEGGELLNNNNDAENSSESDSSYNSRSDFGFPIIQSVEKIARGAIRAAQALEFEVGEQVNQDEARSTGEPRVDLPPPLRFGQSGQVLVTENVRREVPLEEDESMVSESEVSPDYRMSALARHYCSGYFSASSGFCFDVDVSLR
ncbi:uncharacterized protein BDZ99DRAFT_238489 [Mytilinidion resinicola]|uniref:Uncharacterized protein n=1 Tax=Mytilinidion resinicola TaxID=574789 RepID=A0A6A6Z116_9PEZI|nr:uncharacterized protein BDZ99DRAFT_238489 [Mytilinidion resinicola]KAF2814488.1 hypothetical protein BDZ99DRAFT_238489 [Mytilinidion resinicola]